MSLEANFFALAAAYRSRTELGGYLPVNFASAGGESDDGGEESTDRRGGSVIQRVVMIESSVGLEEFLNGDVSEKQGRSPASKSSVESMPRVVIGGDKETGGCSICLEEWSEGDVAAEMPCKHGFHSECVEEWLGMHATCPLCRYEMPVEEVEEEKEVGVWVGLTVGNGGDSNPRDEAEA